MTTSRLHFERWPAAVYAIGDVHGCLEQLAALEQRIVRDAGSIDGEQWLVLLGDLVDRGPDTAGVVSHLLEPPPQGFRRYCLRGNHEQMLLDFLRAPGAHSYWLDEGGTATLRSYGINGGWWRGPRQLAARARAAVPAEHLRFLASLPYLLALPGWIFVHAGLRPDTPLDRQTDEDLIWIREPFLSAAPSPGIRVVHGHTPGFEPVVTPARIGIDTSCCFGGALTAVRITPDGATAFLTAST